MQKKVLVVDDDVKVLKILDHALTREGLAVIQAQSGNEALIKIKKTQPDLILLDLMMPEMDGFETLRQLKTFCDAPVIILSARDTELDKVVGFRMGVDDYQVKPFSPLELALRVKAVLRRAAKAQSDQQTSKIINIDQLVIDYDQRLVEKNGRKIELTPKEFELLWLMASHPNQVFTKERLLECIWGTAFHGYENTVNVHIRRLRERIEDNPSKPHYIKTVWGIGYKFVY